MLFVPDDSRRRIVTTYSAPTRPSHFSQTVIRRTDWSWSRGSYGQHRNRGTANREVAKSTEKMPRFVWETSDFLVNEFESPLWDYYFNWLDSCMLARACQHALLNTPRVILKKACCTASSPNNWKRSSPGNGSVTAQSRDSSSGNSVLFWTAEFSSEVFSGFVANPAGTTD